MGNTILYLKVWAHKITERVVKEKYTENRQAPAMLKRKTVARYAEKFHCNVFIETGTYLGEMIEYQAKNFEKIYSVEIAELFYKFASRRLRNKKNITIVKGDSGVVLNKIMKKLSSDDKVLFWLDGHYSGGKTGKGDKECPVYEELTCIFSARQHKDIILIDDAGCFNGTGDYPKLEELKTFIKSKAANAQIKVKNDMIRVTYR